MQAEVADKDRRLNALHNANKKLAESKKALQSNKAGEINELKQSVVLRDQQIKVGHCAYPLLPAPFASSLLSPQQNTRTHAHTHTTMLIITASMKSLAAAGHISWLACASQRITLAVCCSAFHASVGNMC